MSHEIETIAYAGDTPWHGLGTFVGDTPVSSEDMIAKAGLDWLVSLQPLFTCSAPKDQGGHVISINDWKAIVRASDDRVLGVITDSYEVLQNREAFQVLDSLVADGSMRYHTAGSLRGGQRVWALGKIGSVEVFPGDRTDHFILIYTGHDGATATRVIWTQTRVVCANTARAALTAAKGEGISVRHTKSQDQRLAQAVKVLGIAKKATEKAGEFLKELSGVRLTEEKWVTLARELVPDPAEGSPVRAQNKREELTRLLFNGRGQKIELPGGKGRVVADTLYGARNAFIEYTNYHRQTRGDDGNGGAQAKRFDSSLWGQSAEFVAKADEILLDMLRAPGGAFEPETPPIDAVAFMNSVQS
jgi:phage/plasmid-like protein (TIGR03299 family)